LPDPPPVNRNHAETEGRGSLKPGIRTMLRIDDSVSNYLTEKPRIINYEECGRFADSRRKDTNSLISYLMNPVQVLSHVVHTNPHLTILTELTSL
jgi:hypothetical protein